MISKKGPKRELSVPKATVAKLIREQLPDGYRCSDATTELVTRCCVEFIRMVSSEANDMCKAENKSTITPEHILGALKDLGFESYLRDVAEVYDEQKSEKKQRLAANKEKKQRSKEISEEEMHRAQQELFQKARAQMQKRIDEEKAGIASTVKKEPDDDHRT